MDSYSLIILLPLIGFFILSLVHLLGKKTSSSTEIIFGGLATAVVFIAFVFSVGAFFSSTSQDIKIVSLFHWFSVGNLTIDFAYRFDALSLVMAMLVTGVGGLIHLYSIGYMHGDEGFVRFFSYLNLFIFSMLNLILGENLIVTFLGWEGVGLCSYLLISFWYDREFVGVDIHTTVDAGNKAFIMNRIGDFAFLLGIFILFKETGSLNYSNIFAAPSISQAGLFLSTLLIFIACTGKSAQFPLFTWLPDAMAGPTPVSALIHAATMVTSGLYLTARLSPLFIISTDVSFIIALVGISTAFIAGTIAIVQTDIKKVLAYSTVSQLGYMFLAVGMGAYQLAIFHVLTHAFFKACLFLGSGSVIHAMHEEQDVMLMGGLHKKMPITSLTFLVSSLALAGFPLTAGFFSKDAIIGSSFLSGHYGFFIISVITAFLTAAYSMRLYGLTFLGEARSEKAKHAHESGAWMTIPLIILGTLSIIGGVMGLPAVLQEKNIIDSWLLSKSVMHISHEASHSTEWLLLGLSSLVAIGGLLFGHILWKRESTNQISSYSRNLFFNKYYIDEIYNALIPNGLMVIIRNACSIVEVVILWMTTGIGYGIGILGSLTQNLQNGSIQTYATYIVIGVILLLGFILR